MRQRHYLGFSGVVGESLRYVAEWNGQWLALLGGQAAALKCKPRDHFDRGLVLVSCAEMALYFL